MPETLPPSLDFAQSKELLVDLKTAVANAVQAFVSKHVTRDENGVPNGGPDPRVVAREVGFHLARITSTDYEISIFDTELIDSKLARLDQLERELTEPAHLSPGRKAFAAMGPAPAAKKPPATKRTRTR